MDIYILDENNAPRLVEDLKAYQAWLDSLPIGQSNGLSKLIAIDSADGVTISTEYCGISFDAFDPMVLWESIVLGNAPSESVRYSSNRDALAGHRLLVDRYLGAKQ